MVSKLRVIDVPSEFHLATSHVRSCLTPLKRQQNLIFSRALSNQINTTFSKMKGEEQMQRRYNLAYFILTSVVALGLTMLMIGVNVHAQIVFMSDRDGDREIYVMDADGQNPRRLTNNPADDYFPSWSPDGKHIAFAAERDGNSEIYLRDADGRSPRNLTKNGHTDWDPSWSPDGEHIAFASERGGTSDIYVMNANSRNPRNLTKKNGLDDWAPSWSPDGERIAFVSDKGRNFEIYVMDADGRNPRNLTKNPAMDNAPAWFRPAFAVAPAAIAPAGKKFTMWGWLKQVVR